MIIEITKRYKEIYDRYVLKLNIEFATDEDENIISLVNRLFKDLPTGLKTGFNDHAELYQVINEEKYGSDRYRPANNYFNDGDAGFRQFIQDITEPELRRLIEVYTDLIIEKSEYIQQMYREEHKGRIYTSLLPDAKAIKLEELEIVEPSFIVLNGQNYKLELQEIEGTVTNDAREEQRLTAIRNDFAGQLEAFKRNAERKQKRQSERFQREKNQIFVETLLNNAEMLKDWEYITIEGEMWLKYKHTIETTKIIYNGREYDYDAETYDRLYLMGLKMKVMPNVSESYVKCTRGKNLHFSGTSCCLGSLSGRPLFDMIRELPEVMKIANMDSPLNTNVKNYIAREVLPNYDLTEPDEENEGDTRVRRTKIWRI